MKKFIALAATAVGLLGVASPAMAHVTLQPTEAPADGFTRLAVRVPNERDNASTTRVRVQFPAGFYFISYEPVEGWSVDVKMRKLKKPAEVFGEKIREEVDEVSISTSGAGIAPGQFRDFGLSLKMPNEPGKTLTFKALQTYSNGEVVRWIGPPDAEEPAPQVTLLPSEEEEATHGDTGGASVVPASEETAAADDGEDDDDDGPSTGLVVVALILGALGLTTGIAGLMAARRARTS
jgi:periplasmic copper chaperone A